MLCPIILKCSLNLYFAEIDKTGFNTKKTLFLLSYRLSTTYHYLLDKVIYWTKQLKIANSISFAFILTFEFIPLKVISMSFIRK